MTKKTHVKLIYGNHWNFGINVGDTFLLIKHALEGYSILADIEKEPSPDHINIVMENFNDEYIEKMRDVYQKGGRFIVIGTEFLTGSSFNDFKFDGDSSYYFDAEYWSNRYRCFIEATHLSQAVWHFSDVAAHDFSNLLDLPVFYFPHHHVPGFKQVQHRSDEEKDIDFLFTGAKTDYRLSLLEQLSGKGYKVEVMHALTAPFHRNDLIARSKIALNLKQFEQWPYPSQSRFFYHIINESLLITEATEVEADIQPYVLTAQGNFIEYCQYQLEKGRFNERAQENTRHFAQEKAYAAKHSTNTRGELAFMSNGITLSGQPRSGYALTNNIIHKLKLCAGLLNDDQDRQAAQQITRDPALHLVDVYQNALVDSGYNLDKVIINGEFHSLFGGPKWFDEDGNYYVRKYIGVQGKGDLLINHRIPALIAKYYDTLHSHEFPRTLLSLYPNAHHLASIRNPLDMMNSANHSINALSSEYIQRTPSLGTETEIRESIALSKFSDLRLCEGLIQHQKRYWMEFLPIQEQFYKVVWEDLICFPLETIQKLSRYLNIDLNMEQIRAIWHSMDHKNTLLYHQHNFRENQGVVGDWRNNLVNEHIDLFKDAGFDGILESLGYPQLQYFNTQNYNVKQQRIAQNIHKQHIPSIPDQTLATFAFNKSNIDTSQYDFYRGEWQGNTCIERATFTDHELFKQLTELSEQRIERAFEYCKSILPDNNTFSTNFLHQLVECIRSGEPVGLWGISYDFERLSSALSPALLEHANVTLFDQLEAGVIVGQKTIISSDKLVEFKGKIFAVPAQPGAINSMKRFAKAKCFEHQLITNETNYAAI